MYATLKRAQPRALRIIENSIKNDRLSHAYLFTGPKGTLKKEMAYHLALSLYCKEDTPCYKCPTCMSILENRHLNVFYIEPFGQSIKKEQILALQDEFSKTSLLEGARIYIINEADTMSSSAANSLLKFIEEPTNDETYGILISEHKDNMLSTIISRSMIVAFDDIDKKLLNEQLQSLQASPLTLNCLLYLSNNSLDAEELLNKDSFNKVVKLIEDFTTLLASEKEICLFYRENTDVLNDKDNMKMFLVLLEALFRDVYEYQLMNKVIIFDSLTEQIEKISNNYSKEEVLKYIFAILELSKKCGYNANMSLLINQFLIDLNGGI